MQIALLEELLGGKSSTGPHGVCLVARGQGFKLVGKSLADTQRSGIRVLPVKGVKTTAM
jgi:hypothetical protein